MRTLSQQRNEAELDKILAAAEAGPTGQMLRGLARELAPDSRFAGALDASLRALVTEEAERAQQPARRRLTLPAQPYRTLAFAGLALVLTLALVAVFAVARPRPVSAAEILARAATAGGWRTLHLTWTARSQYGPNQFTDAQNEGWFQAPNRFRLDDNMQTTAGENFGVMVVSDGNQEWQYDGQNNLVYLQNPERALLSLFQLFDLDTIKQEQGQAGYDLKQLNDELVAGRAAYVLDLVAKTGAQAKWAHVRLWIDQQYYLTLRHEAWDAAGNLVASSDTPSVAFDQPLKDGLFRYTPPAGAAILDMRPAPATAQEQVALWQATAAQAGFPVFAPTESANFGTAFRPYYDPSRRVVTLPYGRAPGGVTMYIEEGPADLLRLTGQGEAISVGSLSGQYVTEGQWVTLSIERGGTRILLHAFRAAADAGPGVVEVAQSLAPVAPN